MRLIVQKYGGTSVGSPERIKKVAERLLETQREGNRVVAVISAMAGVTDNLIKLARDFRRDRTSARWIVLLATGEQAAIALAAMAVNALGGSDFTDRRGSRHPDRSHSHEGEDRQYQSETNSRIAGR